MDPLKARIEFDVLKIISGGQTGADRAALDWAIARGIDHGVWCPKGRKAEDGVIEERYLLIETESANYRSRTVANIRDSDATLIFNLGPLERGTLETLRIAERTGRAYRLIQLDDEQGQQEIESLASWMRQSDIGALNVAGPRESKRPGIYSATSRALGLAFVGRGE